MWNLGFKGYFRYVHKIMLAIGFTKRWAKTRVLLSKPVYARQASPIHHHFPCWGHRFGKAWKWLPALSEIVCEKSKLQLWLKIRANTPFMRIDGGNCKINRIFCPIVHVALLINQQKSIRVCIFPARSLVDPSPMNVNCKGITNVFLLQDKKMNILHSQQ